MDAQSRLRHARVFFLVTGDRRRALETQDHGDEAWAAALRARMRTGRRVAPDESRSNTGAWVSNAGLPQSAADVDWVEQSLTALTAEQRACVVIPAFFENGDDRLAGFLNCPPVQARALRWQMMDRFQASLTEADVDRVEALQSGQHEAALIEALTELADRGLSATTQPRSVRMETIWIRRAVMLIIAALVLAPGIARSALEPQGVSWQDLGGLERIDGRLRRIGRGSVTAAEWTPDGTRILLAATTGVYAVEAATLRPVGFAQSEPGTRLLGFSPEGNQVATWRAGALVLRDSIGLQSVYTAASAAWRDTTAVAWDWSQETLALGRAQGVSLLHPRGVAPETFLPGLPNTAELRFSPDGAWLASTNMMRETLLIKADGTRMFGFDGSAQPLSAMAFSGESRRLIAVFGDGLAVADIEGGIWRAVAKRSYLTPYLWVSPDGGRAIVVASAAVADAAELLTIDLDSGKVIRRLRVPRDPSVGAMAVRGDGARALIVNADGLAIWDLDTGMLVAASVDFAPPQRASVPLPVRFSDDGRQLVAPDAYGGLRVLDAASGRIVRVLNENADPFSEATFSPDGQRIMASNDTGVGLLPPAPGAKARQQDPALYVFDLKTGRTTHIFPGASQPQFISPSLMVYLPAERSELRAYDFSTGTNQAWAGARAEHPSAFVTSARPARVAVLNDRALELWEPGAGLIWRTALARTGVDRGLLGRPLAMSGDAQRIVIAEPSLGIRVYAGETGMLQGVLARPITVTFEASLENPLRVAISGDGRWIATIDNRPTFANTPSSVLTVWRAETLRAVERRAYDQARVTGITFSPDSRRLALIRSDYVIEMIELP